MATLLSRILAARLVWANRFSGPGYVTRFLRDLMEKA
jgi:hypothetical protein